MGRDGSLLENYFQIGLQLSYENIKTEDWPEVEFMNVFSWLRVDSRSLRSTLSYESTLMEFTDNLAKPPDFFSIQAVTKDEWTCLY